MNKRWQDRRQRWVAPRDLFDPARCAVDVLPDNAMPKAFVCAHHYSASFPAKPFAIGLFQRKSMGPAGIEPATVGL